MIARAIAAAALIVGSFAVAGAARALPTSCRAYGMQNVNPGNRGVVYSICSDGSGKHRAVARCRAGVSWSTVRGDWTIPGATSYAICPVNRPYISGTVERK